MKTILSTLTVLTIIIFASCQNAEVKIMSQKVDSLNLILTQTSQELSKVDTAAIKSNISSITEDLVYIQTNFKDSATKEQAIFLSDVYSNKKSLKKLLDSFLQLSKEQNYSIEQLNRLKADIENQLVAKNDFDTFYNSESHAISQLIESIQHMKDWERSALERYNKLKPKLDKFKENL